jgi:hypothetical protein
LALKTDGTVVAWGDNGCGQTTVPPGLSGVTAISAGAYHSLALKSDGTVVALGDNGHGQTAVPEGLGAVLAISAGTFHTLALKSDGTVVAWGADSAGDPFDLGQSTVPAGLGPAIAIAAGGWNSLALVGGPRLTVPLPQPDGSAQFTLKGNAGWTYTVEASTNLLDWAPLGTLIATNAAAPFADAAATNYNRRFYRAVAP